MDVFRFLFISAFLVLGGVSGQSVTSQCPDGWSRWQMYCYKFNNVSRVTWSQANDECYDQLGHLLRVETNDEYLSTFLRKELMVHPSDGYWTALNDLTVNQPEHSDSTFMWGNDEFAGDVVRLQHWDREPDNTDFEDCVAVDVQGASSITDCSSRHAYVCEIDKSPEELCPANWNSQTIGDTRCYYVSNAASWPSVVTWQQARKTCEGMSPFPSSPSSRKARLLSITTADVQTFLASGLALVYYGRQLFWTGLNDIDHEGHFIWAGHEMTPFQPQLIKWRREPNNLAGQEHCGVLLPKGVWGDRNCDDLTNYACRMALPDHPTMFNLGCGGWRRAGAKCVHVQSAPTRSWTDARNYCLAKGGDLFQLDSADDGLWLGMQAGQRLSDYGYWIGLQVMEESVRWADGSVVNTNLLSWDREPHSYGHSGEAQSCGAMGYDGNFVDMVCWREKAGTICETSARNSQCGGQGWQKHGSSCYVLDVSFRTHGEAASFCQRASYYGDGYLFALNTQDEKDWLIATIANMTNGQTFYWSSLEDRSLNDWHWSRIQDDDPVATQKLLTWSYEPNNWRGEESCVQVNINGMLNDADCRSTTGFICQKPAPAPPTTSPSQPQTMQPTLNPGQPGNPGQPTGSSRTTGKGQQNNGSGAPALLATLLMTTFFSLLSLIVA
ncbi:hypothetical protein ACOMHN_008695 [Nucella lapillus]